MQLRFKCSECNTIFESEGVKVEYNSPIYGPCWKFMGQCPACDMQSDEYRDPSPGKKSAPQTPSASPGCCCSGGSCGF